MRREKPIQLNTHIDEKLYGHRCLKMIFQPILENSLKYAFPPDKSGSVTISSIYDPEKIIFEIADTGSGMSPETLNLIQEQLLSSNINEVQNSEHIGLNNVHIRLKLYYGEDCGLQIKSSIDLGTSVRIIFNKTELPNLPIE